MYIYIALVTSWKGWKLHVDSVVGMDFDGAATFSVKKTGVQVGIMHHILYLSTVTVTLCS